MLNETEGVGCIPAMHVVLNDAKPEQGALLLRLVGTEVAAGDVFAKFCTAVLQVTMYWWQGNHL